MSPLNSNNAIQKIYDEFPITNRTRVAMLIPNFKNLFYLTGCVLDFRHIIRGCGASSVVPKLTT